MINEKAASTAARNGENKNIHIPHYASPNRHYVTPIEHTNSLHFKFGEFRHLTGRLKRHAFKIGKNLINAPFMIRNMVFCLKFRQIGAG